MNKFIDTYIEINNYRDMFATISRLAVIVMNTRLHWKRAGRSFVYFSSQ